MLRFTYKGFTLAHMDLNGVEMEQVKACQEVIADTFGLNINNVRMVIKS